MPQKKKAPTWQRQGSDANRLEVIRVENTNAISKENNGRYLHGHDDHADREHHSCQLGTVEFLGKPLTVITTDDQLLVAMKPICEGIGLSWQSQYNRIQRDEVLSNGVVVMNTPSAGGEQRTICLPLNLLNGWLFGVDAKRCKPFIRQALVRYKFECYEALAAYWQQRNAKALPEPAALPAPIEQQELTLDYEGRRLRIARLDGAPWLVAADLAAALKLRNSYVILRRLPEEQQRKVLFGKQQVNILNMDGVRRTLLAAEPARAEAFCKWLGQALEVQQVPSAEPLGQNLGREVQSFALDYLGRCQQAIRDAGGKQPEWDAANDQRLADGIAGLLIRDKRWMLTFGPEGEPKLKAIPSDAGVFTDKVLLDWIADPYGAKAELLPGILQAVTTRLAGQVGNRLTRG